MGRNAPAYGTSHAGASDWRHEAACLTEDPELFFPIGNTGPAVRQIEEAKAVCRRCEVVETCLRWALDTGQDAGVWGGLSEDERRSLKRRESRTRRADAPVQMPRPARVQRPRDFVPAKHTHTVITALLAAGKGLVEIGRLLGADPRTLRVVLSGEQQNVSRATEETAQAMTERMVIS